MATSGGDTQQAALPASRFGFSRLRYRLLLLVLLAVLPALVLLAATTLEQRHLAAQSAQVDALRLSRLASANQERLIEGARPLLVILAQNADVQNRDGQLCSALFADILRRFPLYTNVGAITPEGSVFCSALPLEAGFSPATDEAFRRTVTEREFTASGYRVSPPGGRPLMTVYHPAIDESGKLRAVLFARLDLRWVKGFLDSARLAPASVLLITDRSGLVLAHHPDSAAWVGKSLPEAQLVRAIGTESSEGTAQVEGLDGLPRLFAFTALAGPPPAERAWVSVGIPRGVAFAESDRILMRNLSWAGLAFVLALAAAIVVGDLILLRRVNMVVRAAERLTAGDLRARAEVRSADEIGVMARTFNVMADRLEQTVEDEERTNQMLAQRVGELDLLNQLGDLLQVCLTLDEAYGVIGRFAREIFPDDSGVLYTYSSSRHVIEAGVTWGPEGEARDIVFSPERCWALRSGRSHVVTDARAGLLCAHLPDPPPRAYICTPLVAQGEALGVLYLSSAALGETGPMAPGQTKRRLAEAVAAQLALGLANVNLREILRNQSIRDPLTGLYNRRYMEETLEREVRRARRAGRPMAVLMMDLDRFKQLNDTSGHEAGDAFLRELGELLQRGLRREDIACRHGGEEFVVVLPDASLEDARRRAEQLREAVKMLRTSIKGGIIGPLSASIGVAAYPEHGVSGEGLLRAADAALYRAKREGRDRVVVASAPAEGEIAAIER